MDIRDAGPDDHAAVASVVRDAFADDGSVASLVADLRAAGAIEVERVAVDGDVVIGHVALERGWVDAEEALVDVLVLSPLSVVSARQASGIGGRLIEAALDAAGERGEPYVFLEGSPDYYSRRGFEPAAPRGFLRPSERIPAPAFQVAVLDDRGVTGRLVYPDPFWRHDAVGLRGDVLAAVRERYGE
ncbi:N-acetyltransferase [Nocardioides sp.]|uniref:GNAT family N-acetyltransferase n=1 Tax=Nocardioides sp. TaxID=35761 RepID=UPI002ED1B84A